MTTRRARAVEIANKRARELLRTGAAELLGTDADGRVILRRVPAWVQMARKRRRAQRSARKAERRGRK